MSKNNPITEDTLSKRCKGSVINDTVCIDILVPYHMVSDGMPGKGDIADIYILPDSANKSQVIFSNITILDIQKIQGKDGLEQNILIIALPRGCLPKYINSSFNSNVKVLRSVS